jgi:hypothetical protein
MTMAMGFSVFWVSACPILGTIQHAASSAKKLVTQRLIMGDRVAGKHPTTIAEKRSAKQ